MGKVEKIQKSRKEQVCSKCRTVIPVGSAYLKGVLFREKPIIACMSCGLKTYEVTTSDYVKTVGRIVEDWQEDFEISVDTCSAIAEELTQVKDECEERLDNMPEQFQDSGSGEILQERIDQLESVIEYLEDADLNDFLKDAYDELDEESQEIIDAEQNAHNDSDYEEWFDEFCDSNDEAKAEVAIEWKTQLEYIIESFINEQLSELSY